MAECDGCGACCRVFPIFASSADAIREPLITIRGRELPEHRRTPAWRYQLYPLPFLDRCQFLDQRDRCQIYETRPSVCRKFEAGSLQCNQARGHIGLLPLANSRALVNDRALLKRDLHKDSDLLKTEP